MPRTNNKIRIGILGCSDIASRKFLPALLKTDNAVLAAVASREVNKARCFASGMKYDALTYDELVCDADVDLVYISLPNHLHEQWTIRALSQEKHVICEKPLACSSRSVENMVSCARQRGLLLYENIMYLHHPQHAVIKGIIDSGKIGKIRIVRAAFGFQLAGKDSFRSRPEEGGGAFLDLLRYPLSTALFFLNSDFVDCKGFSLYRQGLHIGMHGYAITMTNELFGFSIGFEQPYESFYEIIGERGVIRLNRAYTTPRDLENTINMTVGTKQDAITVPPADHFERMLAFVCNTIRGGDGFDALYASARQLALVSEQLKAGCRDVYIEADKG